MTSDLLPWFTSKRLPHMTTSACSQYQFKVYIEMRNPSFWTYKLWGPPRGLGEQGKMVFISEEYGNKCQILRGTGEQRQYWGTGNIRKQIFGEQGNNPIYFRGTREQVPPPPPCESLNYHAQSRFCICRLFWVRKRPDYAIHKRWTTVYSPLVNIYWTN